MVEMSNCRANVCSHTAPNFLAHAVPNSTVYRILNVVRTVLHI